MGDKTKRLCKWKKSEYERELDGLKEIVREPRYVCVKCGRAARAKKRLCKPVPVCGGE